MRHTHWSKRTGPRRKHDWKTMHLGSWAAIRTEGIANPRRVKRVRKYYARLATRLERRDGKAAVALFFESLRFFPAHFRLSLWHIPRL